MCQMSKGTPLTAFGICHTQELREIAESWGGPPGKDPTDLVRWLCNFNYLLVFFFGRLGNCPSLTFGSLLGRTIKPVAPYLLLLLVVMVLWLLRLMFALFAYSDPRETLEVLSLSSQDVQMTLSRTVTIRTVRFGAMDCG